MEQILVMGIIGTLLASILKQHQNQIHILMAIVTGVLIFLSICPTLQNLINILKATATQAGISDGYFGVVLKVIAVAYLAQFGSQICKDAGESAIAMKVELAGKVFIMANSAPILMNVLDMVLNFL